MREMMNAPQRVPTFVDTHTHVYLPEFDADRAEVMARAQAAGARALLLPAIDEASLEPLMRCVDEHPDLCHPMVGLHPTDLPERPMEALDRLERLVFQAEHPFVGIGEVGMDLYWDTSRQTEQADALRRQAEWAARLGLPLSVHSRRALTEVADVLAPLSDDLSGVLHCFSGTADEARQLLRRFPGFCLGIGGPVTYRKSALPAVLAEAVPLGRVVLETDAPYLPPVPHRGERNEPAYVPLVAECLAAIYGVGVGEVTAQTTASTLRTFPRIGG